ncbi:MAG: putative protease, partial [Modestobacter sp.]|nr:putative protease [Modestobacter sp.]
GGASGGDGAGGAVPSGAGAAAPAARAAMSLDTSSWFESQLPPAADQPEAKIELSTIGVQPVLPTTAVPAPPPLSQVTQDVQEQGGYPPPDPQQ